MGHVSFSYPADSMGMFVLIQPASKISSFSMNSRTDQRDCLPRFGSFYKMKLVEGAGLIEITGFTKFS